MSSNSHEKAPITDMQKRVYQLLDDTGLPTSEWNPSQDQMDLLSSVIRRPEVPQAEPKPSIHDRIRHTAAHVGQVMGQIIKSNLSRPH